MKNIWTIIKKELKRVFTDRRVIISIFLLPPVTIYLLYSLMGLSAEKQNNKVESYHPTIYVMNAPDSITGSNGNVLDFEHYIFSVTKPEVKTDSEGNALKDKNGNTMYVDKQIYTENGITIHFLKDTSQLEDLKAKLKKGDFDLLIQFPNQFTTQVENETDIPNVTVYYYMNSNYSTSVYNNFTYILNQYKSAILNSRFSTNELNVFNQHDMAQGDVNKEKGSIIGTLLPLLLVIYLMAGAMGVGMESIAGEKERGTIATLLITPIKRSQLAIGKIISIAIIAILSSITSFLGLLAVLPQFAKVSSNGGSIGKVSYSLSNYGMIFGIMVTAVLLFVAIIVIVSTYSKTVKEAGTLIMPVYLLVMGAAFFNMFTQDVSQSFKTYLIPIYNIVVALKAAFQFDLTVTNWLITVSSTLIYTVLLIFLIQKMFRSEKIMFNK